MLTAKKEFARETRNLGNQNLTRVDKVNHPRRSIQTTNSNSVLLPSLHFFEDIARFVA